jgi:hypothetical protein
MNCDHQVRYSGRNKCHLVWRFYHCYQSSLLREKRNECYYKMKESVVVCTYISHSTYIYVSAHKTQRTN